MDKGTNQDQLQSAIAIANIPTLACVLVHLTGDDRWIEGRYVPTRTRGLDDNDNGGLPDDVQDEVRTAALDAFGAWMKGARPALPDPPDELLVRIMGVTLGETIPPAFGPMIRHELGLQPEELAFPPIPRGTSALIIGAGISGICAAVAFAKAGIAYTIVERKEAVGGVWAENRYPGAACDVPSHVYSLSFAAGDWTRHFADGREIHRYLETVADDHDVRRHTHFGREVTGARWDEAAEEWEVGADGPDRRETFRAAILISAVGAFNKPRLPRVPGLDGFAGPSVHTAHYPNAGLDLAGKRVVLVGNGASAMQVAPAIAGVAGELTIVRRSPQWAAPFPRFGRPNPDALRWLLSAMPLYRRWYRLRLSWAFNDKQYDSLQQDPSWTGAGAINAVNDAQRRGLTAYMKAELGDAADRLPSYPPFGKRMLLDNGWYRTIARPNVRLVTGAVTEVRPNAVVTGDGQEHSADAIIWATGFDVANFLAPTRVVGRNGHKLHTEWDGDDARAYLGTVVPGFPNFFCLYGPNTQFGHGGSLITVLERQTHYLMSLLRQMFAKGMRTVEVRRDVHDDFARRVDAAHAKMVWTFPGVETYYRNSKGRVVVNNPFRMVDVWEMMLEANLADYQAPIAVAA